MTSIATSAKRRAMPESPSPRVDRRSFGNTRGKTIIRRDRTPVQRARDALLTLMDVEKRDIALDIGASTQVVSNVFLDRHRSADVEGLVVEWLNAKWALLSREEKAAMYALGFKGGVTREAMGWPLPERRERPPREDPNEPDEADYPGKYQPGRG